MKHRSIFVNGIIAVIAGFLCMLLYQYMHPAHQNVFEELVLDSIGLTFILFGLYIRISARGYKSEKHLEGFGLLKEGPYAFVRNPMYLASFLIGLGAIILLFDWWMIPLYVVFFTLWYWPQIHNEQQWLIKKYGQEYVDYCKTTPCFIPRFKSLVSFRAKSNIPLKKIWIKREWNTILIWSLVVVFAESYDDITSYGIRDFAKESVILLLIIFYFTAFAFLFREE